MSGYYHNSEGYFDPTAGKALSNIRRKERSDRRKAIRRQNREKRNAEVYRRAERKNGSGRSVAESCQCHNHQCGQGLQKGIAPTEKKSDQPNGSGGNSGD